MCLLYGDGIRMTVTRYAAAFAALGIFAAVRKDDILQLVMYIKARRHNK
jgi:hypothetical protein